jgi:hypothetical protein
MVTYREGEREFCKIQKDLELIKGMLRQLLGQSEQKP